MTCHFPEGSVILLLLKSTTERYVQKEFFCHIHLIILIISTFSFISIFVNLWREVTNDDKLKFYIAT